MLDLCQTLIVADKQQTSRRRQSFSKFFPASSCFLKTRPVAGCPLRWMAGRSCNNTGAIRVLVAGDRNWRQNLERGSLASSCRSSRSSCCSCWPESESAAACCCCCPLLHQQQQSERTGWATAKAGSVGEGGEGFEDGEA